VDLALRVCSNAQQRIQSATAHIPLIQFYENDLLFNVIANRLNVGTGGGPGASTDTP